MLCPGGLRDPAGADLIIRDYRHCAAARPPWMAAMDAADPPGAGGRWALNIGPPKAAAPPFSLPRCTTFWAHGERSSHRLFCAFMVRILAHPGTATTGMHHPKVRRIIGLHRRDATVRRHVQLATAERWLPPHDQRPGNGPFRGRSNPGDGGSDPGLPRASRNAFAPAFGLRAAPPPWAGNTLAKAKGIMSMPF